MLSILLLIICISHSHSWDIEEEKTFNCTLPQFPKNGGYFVRKPENVEYLFPGQKVKEYKLALSCNPGYRLYSSDTKYAFSVSSNMYMYRLCFEDGFVTGENIECLRILDEQTKDVEEEKTFNCTLPPFLKNGGYFVVKPENVSVFPGQKVKEYSIVLTCNPGYHLYSSQAEKNYYYETNFLSFNVSNIRCYKDGAMYNEHVECLPLCTHEDKFVMTCGEETRCITNFTSTNQVSDYKLGMSYDQIPDQLKDCGLPSNEGIIYSRKRRSDPPYSGGSGLAGATGAYRDQLPWHAAIYTKRKQPYMQICGGSLISTTVVISAAHCFWSNVEKLLLPASDYAVAVGKLYRPWNNPRDKYAQKSDVAEIKITPYFKGSDTHLQDDIALVIVSSPFKFFQFNSKVHAVCLDFDPESDKNQLQPGRLGTVAGWGLTSDDGLPSAVLQVAQMPVVDIKQCYEQSDPAFRAHITNDKICAGYQNGTAVCHGDSGGGLFFSKAYGNSYRYFLRGVVSGAPSNDHLCNTEAWGSFTHVLKHEHFIRETVPAAAK